MIDDEVAARLCLLSMPGMGPARLNWLTVDRSSVSALAAIRRGVLPPDLEAAPSGVGAQMIETWHHHARQSDGAELLEKHRLAGVQILAPGDDEWPYTEDPEPPSLLFVRGRTELLIHQPLVGVVGTRRCSSVGRRVARKMGVDLASAGVGVASGLALGIDGAAHSGVLDLDGDESLAVGVVACGLDVVYPKTHNRLWDEVAERGLLVSEAPLGTMPQRWRFPARNRLLAGLVDVVVVVESHHKGGALSTVDEAASRSVEVLAVPGSVLSAASDGTNALLLDGCGPARDAQDVLDFLGVGADQAVGGPRSGGWQNDKQRTKGGQLKLDYPTRTNLEQQILSEIRAGGLHLDALFAISSSSLAEVIEAVQILEGAGLVELDGSMVTLGGDSC